MLDILSEKELEGVLLHEYSHLASNSSLYKTSNWLYSRIPLLHAFLDGRSLEDEEEREADAFAAKRQGTRRFLNSAKRKLKVYYSF
jgi:Zn-dependent protease with chaperone function